MSEYALRLTNGTDTAPRVRLGDALAQLPAGVLQARNGLRNDGGGAVTAVAGTMGVSVAPLMAWVDGGSSLTQGGYAFVLDAAKTLTLANGHASLARVDTIAVVVRETAFDGGGVTSAAVEVIAGTPGAGAPALPASAVPLRDINVPAGLSAGTGGLTAGNLGTDRRVYTAAAGGLVRVASQTERDALDKQPGLGVYRTDTKVVELWTGSSWDTYSPDGGAWTAYTPSFVGGTTAVTVGNGSWSAAYRKRGRLVDFRAEFTMGSTTSIPAGQIAIGLPTPPVTGHWTFTGMLRFGSSVIFCLGEYDPNTQRLLLWCEPTTSGAFWRAVTATVPAGLSSGHTISLSGVFESAS